MDMSSDSSTPARRAVPIVALDYSSIDEARTLVKKLGDSCDFYKVGSELFTAAGPDFIRELREEGKKIFLDLKFHDIPNTVLKAASAAARMGISLMTVHASGGERMIAAAVEGANEGAAIAASLFSDAPESCGVLAVTVLTSLNPEDLKNAWNRSGELDLEQEVIRLAGIAAKSKAHGVVCSGQEVGPLSARYSDKLRFLVPGIRLSGTSRDDQARVVTPQFAVEAGASYIILGRTVTSSSNPQEAMQAVWDQI